jgi:hypothetical protein
MSSIVKERIAQFDAQISEAAKAKLVELWWQRAVNPSGALLMLIQAGENTEGLTRLHCSAWLVSQGSRPRPD